MTVHDDFYEFSKDADDERLRQHFRDFLIAPEISGAGRSLSTSKRIPAERITDSGEIVEISQEEHGEGEEAHQNSVMIHRNEFNDITGIEILCACGRTTMIRLENDLPPADDTAEQGDIFNGRQSETDDAEQQ